MTTLTPRERELREAWRAVANAKMVEYRRQCWRLAHLARQGMVDKTAAVDRLYEIAVAHALVRAHGEDRVEAILAEAFTGADFHPLRAEVATISELKKRQKSQPRERLVPIPWGNIQLLPRREPLIDGVFDVGAMSALVGASGAYKTGIAIDWAGHIGTGVPWRDLHVRKGVSLYLAVEGGRGIAERFKAWRQHNGVDADDGDVYVIPEPIDLAHGDADTRLLLQRIADIGRVDFIVVDTVSRSLAGGDENSSKDMGWFVRNGDLIRSETGAHLCALHHLGKDESRGARGHSLLKAALDTELTATKAGRFGTLELTKQRDGPDGKRWGFAIELVDVSDGKQSYVVIPADTPTPAKSSQWTRGLSVFREATAAAILSEGQDHRPGGDGPIVKAVAVDGIRAQHNRLYVHGGDGDRAEAERKAWRRALKSARDNHLIGSENSCGRDFVWLVS